METLNILIFNWKDPTHPEAGGAEITTHELARRWVEWGHRVHLFCGNYKGGKRRDNLDGVEITRLGGQYTVYPSAISHYFSQFKEKFDIVIDEINTVPFFTPLFVKEPKVAFIHQIAREVLFTAVPYFQAKFWSFMEPHVLGLYKDTPIITVSQSTKRDLVKMNIQRDKVYVVGNGVDHGLYQPCPVKNPYPHVIYVGRIRRNKGIHYLVGSMKQVVEKLPNAQLSVVGKGDREYLKSLKQLTIDLKLEKNIIFHGYLTEEEKIRLMQEAHVLAIHSQYEGFGLVVVEANACGTPVIATDVPGLRDTVVNGETGLLVPYRHVESLSSAILQILTDDGMREKMSRRAIERASNYCWERSAREFLGILKENVSVES